MTGISGCKSTLRRIRRACLGSMIALALAGTAWAQADAVRDYDVPAGELVQAVNRISQQSGVQVIYDIELLRGRRIGAVNGQLTLAQALGRALAGSGLTYEFVNGDTVVIKQAPQPERSPARPANRSEESSEGDIVGMPAIMVQGTRTLNMDIARTRDDPQPYVVFDRHQIERSGATSLEQFLQQRLTMNTNRVNAGGGAGANGNAMSTSSITLRGLSASQTLILIDGHRLSSPAVGGSFGQPEITGLPLSAIERIEVLPTTASGIYGGSATGGVINIIMRRDYTGAEVKLTYGNTFDTDTATRKMDLMFGHAFNSGRTNLLLTAHYSDANDLLVADRDFLQRGRDALQANSPSMFLPPYGLPPLGATPNIMSADGSNLVLRDGTPLDAAYTTVPLGYAGPGSDGGHALLANAGSYNWDPANTSQTDGGQRQALYTQPTVKSGGLVLRHEFDESLQVFTDLSSSETTSRFPFNAIYGFYQLPADAPNNPFAQAIRVRAPVRAGEAGPTTTVRRERALLGAIRRLPGSWQVGADYTWDRTTVSFARGPLTSGLEAAVAAGALDVLRDIDAFPLDFSPYLAEAPYTSPVRSTMQDVNLRISGPVWELPGGVISLSSSLAHREQSVSDAFDFYPSANATYYDPVRSQEVTSAYVELAVPLFSDLNARPLLRGLELQVAVRRDDYRSESGQRQTIIGPLPTPLPEAVRARNDFVSTDPTVALRWRPWRDLAFRASYSTGFLPPALNQLVGTTSATAGSLATVDPLRGNTPAGPFFTRTGGNADLTPEQSKSWSMGFILAPEFLTDFRLSLDYTRIRKTDNIGSHPGYYQGLINDESLFPERIVRGPNLPDDPSGWAGPIVLVDYSAMNLARQELEAWDLQLDYRIDAGSYGSFDLFAVGTWQPHLITQLHPDRPEIDYAGISSSNPVRFKANLGATWYRDAWRVGWNANHHHSHLVELDPEFQARQGRGGRIPSQTYHDLFVHYDFGYTNADAWHWLSRSEVQLGVRNVFDKAPPLEVMDINYYSRLGDARMASWYLVLTTRF